MKATTEEFLYVLLWTAESLMRPTWRNLNDGFEAWAWRSGLGRRVAELRQQQLLETVPLVLPHAVVRLTDAGRLAALGGRDPEVQWARTWDGRWRMVLFDVPVAEHAMRVRLWRNLRRHGFGFLQNSVWITPDPIDRARLTSENELPSVEAIIVVEGNPCCGESNAAIVAGSWSFDEINEAYRDCLGILEACPKHRDYAEVRHWAKTERAAWNRAIRLDPLLPAALLPAKYMGRAAWARRKQVLGKLGQDLAGRRAGSVPRSCGKM